MTLPNFLIVGAEKCGTTALYSHVAAHPQAFMSSWKEPSYFLSFDPLFVNQKMGKLELKYVHSCAEYEALFEGTERHLIRGEASPCYLYSKVAPARIREALPDAKIAILLRDPAERAWSQFLYNQQKGWEDRRRTFAEALILEERRVAANEMWAFHYVARSRYYEQVKRYIDAFGKHQVRVWLSRDFNTDPVRVLAELHAWLGIEHILPNDLRARHNPTSLSRVPLVQNLTDRRNRWKSAVGLFLPRRARRVLLGRVRRWNGFVPAADHELLARLRRKFADDIEQLATIIEPDPMCWLAELSG